MDSTGSFFPLTDALGSTVGLTDATGALQTQYTYEPFGNTTTSGPANANPYQFTGRENDGTGLYYDRARYYSPIYQRFTSEDPAGFAGSGVNLYAYAGNNPVSFSDPYGLHWYFNWAGLGGGDPDAPNKGCSAPSALPHSGAIVVGAEGTAGIAATGARAQGTYGVFGSIAGNAGDFNTASAFANFGSQYVANVPQQDTPIAFGGYAGAGVGVMFSNATNISQISGPFETYTLSIPLASFSFSTGGGIWEFQATVGPGLGLSHTYSTSNTSVMSNSQPCP
jgi:RHS repeat-associated protein